MTTLGVYDETDQDWEDNPEVDRDTVARKIMEEVRSTRLPGVACTMQDAHGILNFLSTASNSLRQSRPKGGNHYALMDENFRRYHAIFNIIMPDDQQNPVPGSAHDGINLLLLESGERCLVHTKDDGRDGECSVMIELL